MIAREASKTIGLSAIAVAGLAMASNANAAELTLSTSLTNGTQAATANFIFDDSGGSTTLSIQLINDMTVTGEGTNPQWLQGVFFDLAGSPTMSYVGMGGDGTDDFNDMIQLYDGATSSDPDTFSPYTDVTVDHFWGLRDDISGGELPFGDQQYGLGAAGFGVFGPGSLNYQAGGPDPQLDLSLIHI